MHGVEIHRNQHKMGAKSNEEQKWQMTRGILNRHNIAEDWKKVDEKGKNGSNEGEEEGRRRQDREGKQLREWRSWIWIWMKIGIGWWCSRRRRRRKVESGRWKEGEMEDWVEWMQLDFFGIWIGRLWRRHDNLNIWMQNAGLGARSGRPCMRTRTNGNSKVSSQMSQNFRYF